MLAAWDEAATAAGCTRRKLVANLPYVIATPLISNLLIAGTAIERMVVMVQWEIAERMRAVPGTKDYNALSVLVQSVADVEVVRKVLPTNFYPRPKVDSAIVLITAERREAGEGRRRAAVPGVPARPVRPPAEEPAAGARRAGRAGARTRPKWTRSSPELGIDGTRALRGARSSSSTCGCAAAFGLNEESPRMSVPGASGDVLTPTS